MAKLITNDFPSVSEQIEMTEKQINNCSVFINKFVSGVWASFSDEKRLQGINQYAKEKLRLEKILVELCKNKV